MMNAKRTRLLVGGMAALMLSVALLVGLAGTAEATPGRTAACWKSGCHSVASTQPTLTITNLSGPRIRIKSTNAKDIAVYLGSVKKKVTSSKSFIFTGIAGKTYTVVAVSRAGSSHRISRKVS